jgi:hypothetical protein
VAVDEDVVQGACEKINEWRIEKEVWCQTIQASLFAADDDKRKFQIKRSKVQPVKIN